MALCTLALQDNPHLVFLAGDFTVGETKSKRTGLRFVKEVLSRLRRTRPKAWARIEGVIYSIEIGRSRTGRWWVHAHTFLALDARDQPPARMALAREWAKAAREIRWPDEPFDPRSGNDRRYNRLMRSQSVKPLFAYTRMGMTTRLAPVESISTLEADLRARARYLRERKGEPGHERVLALTRLTETDRLSIIDLRARLNARLGVFRFHDEAEVKALATSLRDRRMKDLSIRRIRAARTAADDRRGRRDVVRVRPSSPEFRARLRAHVELRP